MPLPRHLPALLFLAAAPLLGGCTLTFGTTGALIDRSAARQPVARYTLDAPPPYNTPVELVTRTGASITGRWLGMEGARDSSAASVVVLAQRSRRFELGARHVVQVRGRPAPARATAPLVVAGMAVDALIVYRIIHAFNNSCACQGCCGE